MAWQGGEIYVGRRVFVDVAYVAERAVPDAAILNSWIKGFVRDRVEQQTRAGRLRRGEWGGVQVRGNSLLWGRLCVHMNDFACRFLSCFCHTHH